MATAGKFRIVLMNSVQGREERSREAPIVEPVERETA